LWSTNETSDSIWNLKSDTFTLILSADSGLCQLNDTVTITSPPQIHITQGDTAFCEGDSILLDLGSYQQFVWHDGQSGQYRWVKEPDSLQAKVQNTDGCWSEMETIHLRMDQPPSIQLGNDTTICYGESIDLDAGAGFDDYLWSTFSNMSSINILHTGIYWVAVYEKTCVVVDSIEVFNCPPVFNVPNVFTPNGDGFNDELEIEYQNIFKYEIKIYNRWGVRVFESEDLNNPWNGKIKGMDAVEGVYFWEIIYQEYNGQGGGNVTKGLKGTVSLYR
jgi:gliding motility-associated-like protein